LRFFKGQENNSWEWFAWQIEFLIFEPREAIPTDVGIVLARILELMRDLWHKMGGK
jgi:hypothetical protein